MNNNTTKYLSVNCTNMLVALLFVCQMLSNSLEAAAIHSPMKLRGGFMGLNDLALLPVMGDAGLNTALVAIADLRTPISSQCLSKLTLWAEQCQSSHLAFMPVFNYWGSVEKDWFTPSYNYYTGGKTFNNPCPFAQDSYQMLIHKRLLDLAKLSLTIPISGAILDTEMYGGNHIAYTDLCFCDGCWHRSQLVMSELPDKNATDRQSFLVQSGLIAKYRQASIEYLEKMARQTRIEIQNISPNFVVGVFKLDQLNPVTEAVARGFGLKDNPVIIFSEHTYSIGYSNYIRETIDKFKDMEINAKFITGIWQDKFLPENLSEQYYYCAKDCDGYWVYQICSLNPNWKEIIAADRNSYWDAIHKANDELDKLCKKHEYKSQLVLRKARMPLDPIDFNSIKTESLTYIYPDAVIETDAKPLYFHSFNKLIFNATKGEKIKFRIKFTKRPDTKIDYAEVALLTKTGQVLSKDQADGNKDAVVEALAPSTATYCIVLNPERNLLSVISFTHPYSIDADKWPQAHFIRPSTLLYLWQKPNYKKAEVSYFVDGVGESVTTTFSTLEGKLIAEYDILAKQTVTVKLPESLTGQIIVMNIKPRPNTYFEDVFVTIESGFENYISPFKAGLLKHYEQN